MSAELIQRDIVYNATRTAATFHCDDSFVRLLFGPVGCGKSVADCVEVMTRAGNQKIALDGIRYSRWAIIRNTYPELKSTTIKTWLDWFPEDLFGRMKFDSPISHRIRIDNIDLEVFFIALDSEQDIKKLMSLELTGVYINEAQFVPKRVFEIAQQRVDRFPKKSLCPEGGWAGVIADTNPPDTDHWIYKTFEENRPDNYKIFKYPPAVIAISKDQIGVKPSARSLDGTHYILNSEADYLRNLRAETYYLNQIPAMTDAQIKVFLQGEYGFVADGKPVYPEYNDILHYYDDDIQRLPDVPLGFGWDFGLTPSLIITQVSATGRLVVLDELVSEDIGITQFSNDVVIPYLNANYYRWKENYISVGDPAGNQRVQTDEKTCLEVLKHAGIITKAAITNSFIRRREGVAYFLTRMADSRPALLLSKKAKVLRKGFNGAYHYKRIKLSDKEETYKDEPVKNDVSHPHDAFQYIAMDYHALVGKPKAQLTARLSTRIH